MQEKRNSANYKAISDISDVDRETGTTSVGTCGGPSYFGTYDQGGNVEEFIEKGVLLATNSTYVPEDFVVGKGFKSATHKSSLLEQSENPIAPVSIMSAVAGTNICRIIPTACRWQPPGTLLGNKIFVKDSDSVHLRANMLVSGPGVPNNTKITQITDDRYDLYNDGDEWRLIVVSKNLNVNAYTFTDLREELTEQIEFNYEYVPYDENLYVQIGDVLVTDYIPTDYAGEYDYIDRTLFVPESKMSEIRTGWAVYGDGFPDSGGSYVQYVGPVLIPFPETGRTEKFYEVVVNVPYDQSNLSFVTGDSGRYASVKIKFLSGFYGEDNLPGSFPTLPGPKPINLRSNFGFAKATRGGSYETGVSALSKTGNKSNAYVPVDATSPSVGFRICSIHEELNYTARVYRPNYFNEDIIFIPVLDVAPTFEEAEEIIKVGMMVSAEPGGSALARYMIPPNSATIIGVNNIFLDGDEYVTIQLDQDLKKDNVYSPNTISRDIPVLITLSNPSHVLDMVLVDEENNPQDGFSPGYGRVNKKYWIGKYPVTNGEYAAYLNHINSIADDDTMNAFYNPAIDENNLRMAVGIDRHEEMDIFPGIHFLQYAPVDGMEDHPVVGITWMQAARYCNWLHNMSMDWHDINTNDGAYDMSLPVQTMPRKSDARYFLPNENEWYKAAYYGKYIVSAGWPAQTAFKYFEYPTGFDDPPAEALYNATIERNYFPMFWDHWEVDPTGGGWWETVEDPVRRGQVENLWESRLFNKYAFYHYLSVWSGDYGRWFYIFNRAFDRLDTYWSSIGFTSVYDPSSRDDRRHLARDGNIYDRLKRNIEASDFANLFFYGHRFNGIIPIAINFFNNPNSNTIASCVAYGNLSTLINFRNIASNTTRNMCGGIDVNINRAYELTLSDNDWMQVISHELIHGLGFGTMHWSLPNENFIEHPLDDDNVQVYVNSENFRDFFQTTIRYSQNAFGGNARRAVPFESAGGAGTAGGHWENNYIANGHCSPGMNCANADYPGISNDLMIGSYVRDAAISATTVAFVSDLGWYVRSGQASVGERNFTPDYGDTQTQSLSSVEGSEIDIMSPTIEQQKRNNVIGRCSRSKK